MGEEEKKDTIRINTTEIKKGFNIAVDFFKNKKVQNILIIVLLLAIIIFGIWIRTQNLPLLVDQTTGKSIPLALDPFYFLRAAETIVEQGGLPEIDVMRYPSAMIKFSNEILPRAVIFIWDIWKVFDSDVSLQFIDVISPVIFFVLGLIVFFLLISTLTNSKITALISSGFLAIIPTYLYRTMAGFSDHESIGMFAFFLTLLGYTYSLKYLNKNGKSESKKVLRNILLFGILTGFLSAFTLASWGGIANFVFMIIPLSFLLCWLITFQKKEDLGKKPARFLGFYVSWILSSIIFGLMYNYSIQSILNKVILASSSIVSGVVLLFVLSDILMIKYGSKIKISNKYNAEKYRVLYSLLITIIIGIIFLSIYKGNIISYISDIMGRLLHPFGTGREGLTVAENRQPFLNDWISQTGKVFFWLFFGGLLTLGMKISKMIRKNKNKIFFGLFWILFVTGVLFSRISSTSLFNGVNFISQLVYIGSTLLFFAYLAWVYFHDEIKLKPELIILFSWMVFMLISARGAIRLFFVITPFVCFSAGFFILSVFKYAKSSKDDLLKMILWVLFVVILIGAVISSNNFIDSSIIQAKYTGPSANSEWQQAMEWVRENTPEESIFVHWWDYGHWVTYLGERRVITDGGHAVGYWDHLIGRYLLTTPYPETALSFMKSHNVNYLLIDPSDIGKYTAYSSIGSDINGEDRLSWIPVMRLDPSQTQETSNGVVSVFIGGQVIDKDIIFKGNGQEIFLPAEKAGLAAITIGHSTINNEISFSQPTGIFVYNNQRYDLPIRYLYYDGDLIDFGSGVNSLVRTIPGLTQQNQGISATQIGAVMYLSEKTKDSLFAQLYLLDDPENQYPTIKIAHVQDDPIIQEIKRQGMDIGNFVYYQGLRGPIKIWKVDYPSNILEKEEFLRSSGEYGEFDNLQFTI